MKTERKRISGKKLLSLLIAAVLIISQIPLEPKMVSAAENVDVPKTETEQTETDGLCKHHTAHTSECGYVEAVSGTPCTHEHEHTEDCYTIVTKCVHKHMDKCYPQESVSSNVVTSSDTEEKKPTECTYMCSEESGCIMKVLDCQHVHDENCDYTEGTPGSPCTFVCEVCNPQNSNEQEEPKCICKTRCTEDNINMDCQVCGVEGADLKQCVGLLPAVAFAAEGELPIDGNWTGGTYTVTTDTEINNTVTVTDDVILDFQSGTLTINGTNVVSNQNGNSGIKIEDNDSLTIMGTNGTLKVTGGNGSLMGGDGINGTPLSSTEATWRLSAAMAAVIAVAATASSERLPFPAEP